MMDVVTALSLVVVVGVWLFRADNWARELEKWCPDLKVLVYYGKLNAQRNVPTFLSFLPR